MKSPLNLFQRSSVLYHRSRYDKVAGHSNTILARGGRNLNNSIFKKSNAGGLGDVEVSL